MKLAAVVLAAGRSARFGADKRLADLRGRPLIVHALEALGHFDFAQRIAVVRADDPVADIVRRHGVEPVINAHAAEGMGTSLACGISALDAVDGAFIVLADMPDIPRGLYAAMARRFAGEDADIVVPRHGDRDGHPVLFGAVCFADLKAMTGDRGGRATIASGLYDVTYIETAAEGILRDVDRPEDLI